ncbi:MAG: M23 family metallopeptidase [Sandaracinaceae bacterium]|nr:M23 family metallopeptidase [Sandaracinaceae bacterium]
MRRSLPLLVCLAVAVPALADAGDSTGGDPNDADEGGSIDVPEAGCDASAGGEADIEELVASERNETIPATAPTRWRTTAGRQCHRYRGRAMCEGPRRVPQPFGPAAELARTLGLDDDVRAGHLVLSVEPRPEWRAAVRGEMGAGLLWPVPGGRLWRGFGMQREIQARPGQRLRRGPRRHLHRGVDIGAPAGTAIRAVNDGLVLYSFNSMRGYGNSVVILHADGTVSLYAHCQATYVFAGQRVERGRVIAEVGHTGLAHGDHLHFEWRRNGRPLNPARHFVDGPREDRVSLAP